MTGEGIHDAVRHSTAQTHVREALEAWDAARAAVSAELDRYGTGNALLPDDPKLLKQLLADVGRVANRMAEVLNSVHWPIFDPAQSRKTDERAHELAARMLREYPDQPELAWRILSNAFRLACDHARAWRRTDGVDLSLYYRCEAETVLEVLEHHYAAKIKKGGVGC